MLKITKIAMMTYSKFKGIKEIVTEITVLL